jgi:methyl acetate hydrolase
VKARGGGPRQSDSAATTAELDRQLSAAVARKDIPGLVAIAGDARGLVYQGAFGLAETGIGRAMTLDAIFRIASMTKPVTTVALLQLVEAGRLNLDDPAADYLPALANPTVAESFDLRTGACRLRPAASPITVRQLLTHTSGLGYPFTSPILARSMPRTVEEFAAGPLLFDPGAQWHYGAGVDVAGRIVESLSGRNLESHFQERILQPLGMVDTSSNVPVEKQPRVVNLHHRAADGSLVEDPCTPPPTVPAFVGGTGLYSTAGDYLRFLRMLLNGGELDGVRILTRDTVASMGRNQIGDLSARALQSALPWRSCDLTFIGDGRDKWGLGFLITAASVAGKRSAGSLSWGGINNTYFWLDPVRGVAGVILMQFLPFADPKALGVCDTFERGVYQLVGQ